MTGLVCEYLAKWDEAEAFRGKMPSSVTDMRKVILEMDAIMKKVVTEGEKSEFEKFIEEIRRKLHTKIDNEAAAKMAELGTELKPLQKDLEAKIEAKITQALNNFIDGASKLLPTPKPDYMYDYETQAWRLDHKTKASESVNTFVRGVTENILSTESTRAVLKKEALHQLTLDLPLLCAAELGKLDIVKFLVETKGADVNCGNAGATGNTMRDLFGPVVCRFPIEAAACGGDTECLKYLIDKGANPSATATHPLFLPVWEDTPNPLWWAVHKKRAECAKLLLDAGADVNQTNMVRRTPLWSAVTNDDVECV